MESIFKNSLRVYLAVAFLAILGVFCALHLPVSLFPNSTRPSIFVRVNYGGMSADDFRQQFGRRIEAAVRDLSKKDLKLERLQSTYGSAQFSMNLLFNWGADPDIAMRESRSAIQSATANLPEEIRRNISINAQGDGLAMMVTFSSQKRGLDEVYRLIEPQVVPKVQSVESVESAQLVNPTEKEIEITLKPDFLLQIGLTPSQVEAQVQRKLYGFSAGTLRTSVRSFTLTKDADVQKLADLQHLPIQLASGATVPLGDMAMVSARPSTQSLGIAKTEGQRSLVLLIYPKQGGNLKKMSTEIMDILEEASRSLPIDIERRVVVDKSESIQSSINHVALEVLVGSLLATFVLYLFIGSLRNVMTAAVEIPLSLVMAFILMKIFDVNINLFSLAGLALASGMNVDASVVVMENIFRHLELRRSQNNSTSLMQAMVEAVNEVKWPVIISTVASLVVFIPFLMLEGLGQALLGDLVKAVIFSHGLSAGVALILVPTFRYHFNRDQTHEDQKSALADPVLKHVETFYLRVLQFFNQRHGITLSFLGIMGLVVVLSSLWIAQRLPRQIVGKPDSDWIIVHFETDGNTLARQMEAEMEPFARSMKQIVGSQSRVQFAIIDSPNTGFVAVRIKDKTRMKAVEEALKASIKSQAQLQVFIETWNQSELSLPETPAFRLTVAGGTAEERAFAAEDLARKVRGLGLFERIATDPPLKTKDRIVFTPRADFLGELSRTGAVASESAILDDLRVIGDGKWIGDLKLNEFRTPLVMRYPEGYVDSIPKLSALPIRVGDQVVPLRSLMDINRVAPQQNLQIENGFEYAEITAFKIAGGQTLTEQTRKDLAATIHDYQQERNRLQQPPLVFNLEDPNPDQTQAVHQLGLALGLSIALLFLTIIFHFGNFVDSMLVMLAVPFAIFGSLASLWIFSSSISLNSLLGMTLLSGVAVNNSIMLVDFMRIAERAGHSTFQAVVLATRARLRPILITSLTTILGMLPIALGLGEGGKVLSPLGISVAGGLVVSTGLTLLFVPMLQNAKGFFRSRSAGPERFTKEVVC